MPSNNERQQHWREKRKHPCIDCGNPCYDQSIRCKRCSIIFRKNPKFCVDCGISISRASKRCNPCAVKESWQNGNKISVTPRGEKNWHWKGGRLKTSSGYIMMMSRNHPRSGNSGYVLEHILVWEEAHGKPLPKGWIIHHLNGIKDDNRLVNLEAMPDKKHYRLLQAKAKRIQELEALLNGQHQLL